MLACHILARRAAAHAPTQRGRATLQAPAGGRKKLTAATFH